MYLFNIYFNTCVNIRMRTHMHAAPKATSLNPALPPEKPSTPEILGLGL